MGIRSLVRSALPGFLRTRIDMARARRKNARYINMTPQQVFSEIYQNGLWGKSPDPAQPFYSGSGSHDPSIAPLYIEKVRDFLRALSTKPNVVDLGCGDFVIGSQIRPLCASYIACDVVPALVEFNRIKYGSSTVDFRVVDIVSGQLPAADVVFIRQVLQHLSNSQVAQVVSKIASNYRWLVLTEHLPKAKNFIPNLDKPAGPDIRLGINSGIVLTKPPFSMRSRSERVLCEVEEYGGVIRTTVYEM